MLPNTITELSSIQTPNQVILDPRTKPSKYRFPDWNQVNSDLPHWNQAYFEHLHSNQVNFDVNAQAMPFSACVIVCYTHVRVHAGVIQRQYVSHKYE